MPYSDDELRQKIDELDLRLTGLVLSVGMLTETVGILVQRIHIEQAMDAQRYKPRAS